MMREIRDAIFVTVHLDTRLINIGMAMIAMQPSVRVALCLVVSLLNSCQVNHAGCILSF